MCRQKLKEQKCYNFKILFSREIEREIFATIALEACKSKKASPPNVTFIGLKYTISRFQKGIVANISRSI